MCVHTSSRRRADIMLPAELSHGFVHCSPQQAMQRVGRKQTGHGKQRAARMAVTMREAIENIRISLGQYVVRILKGLSEEFVHERLTCPQ